LIDTTEILIVGGGIIGNSIAYHLACAGRSVVVIDRAEIPTEPSASWASAGGIRRQGRHQAEIPLATEASARWPLLARELEANLDYRSGGNLLLAESDAHAQRLAAFVERQHRNGLTDVTLVDQKQVRELAPDVAPHVVAGSYSPRDGYADPIRTTTAFATAAQRRGAKYRTSTRCDSLIRKENRVTGVRTSRGAMEAEITIVAAGAWSVVLAASIGLDLPLRVEALQMIRSTAAPAYSLKPVLASVGRKLSLKQLSSRSFLLGGGWLGSLTGDTSYRLDPRNINGNWGEGCAILPKLARERIDRAWCGLEATSPDGLPLVGAAPEIGGLFLAVGFSGHGFAIAPAVGRATAHLIAGELVSELNSFRPERFRPV
jgi:sarcosine oxidase subunit beta